MLLGSSGCMAISDTPIPAQSWVPMMFQCVPESVDLQRPPLGAHAYHTAVSWGSTTTRLTRPAPPTSGAPVGTAFCHIDPVSFVRADLPARSHCVASQTEADLKDVAPSKAKRAVAKCLQRMNGLKPFPLWGMLSAQVESKEVNAAFQSAWGRVPALQS